MSLGVFSYLIFWKSLRKTDIHSSLSVSPVKPSGPGLFFVGSFIISISLLIIDLFRLSIHDFGISCNVFNVYSFLRERETQVLFLKYNLLSNWLTYSVYNVLLVLGVDCHDSSLTYNT